MAAGRLARVDGGERRSRFENLYAANYPSILAYALRRTQTPDDAADVVAETFLAAWRRIDDVPAGREARLWLYGTARLVLSNHRRGKRRQERLGERLRSTTNSLTTELPGDDGDRSGIAAAFARLRPDDREILTLVAVEGLTPAEVARVLDCGGVAARVRLHRARARFARELAATGVAV